MSIKGSAYLNHSNKYSFLEFHENVASQLPGKATTVYLVINF